MLHPREVLTKLYMLCACCQVLGLWLVVLPAALLMTLESIDLATPPHWSPQHSARRAVVHVLLGCTSLYMVVLMAAHSGLKLLQAHRGFPLVQVCAALLLPT